MADVSELLPDANAAESTSNYERLRAELMEHYRQSQGCCGYGYKAGASGRQMWYPTVSHLCPTALAILKQIEQLF